MASKPLTAESIALTEKKMEMSLDDIIKMAKNVGTKGKKTTRVSNKKSQGFKNGGRSQAKVKNFLDSRSSIRQGALAKRRTNTPGTHFSITTEVARRAANVPILNGGVNSYKQRFAPVKRNVPVGKASNQDMTFPRQRQTLDARFSVMKEQRMKVTAQQVPHGGFNVNALRRRGQQQHRQQQQQQQQRGGRVTVAPGFAGRRFGN